MATTLSIHEVAAVVLLYTAIVSQLGETQQECVTGDLRTVRGDDPQDGRDYPLYCYNGQWRRLCAGGTWTVNSARVACQQLGYSAGLQPISKSFNCPGMSFNLLSAVTLATPCDGTESRIQECEIQENQSCNCVNTAWLTCPTVCTSGDIRLVGGSTNSEGRVEVCVDGRWGTVCNNNQELPQAVCSQLGYLSQGATTINATLGDTLHISTCTVSDGRITNCSLITNTICDHSMDLGVVCRTYYELLYNELLSSTGPQPTCPSTVQTQCPTINSLNATESSHIQCHIFGVLFAILFVVLVAVITGWTISCTIWRRSLHQKQRQVDDQVYDNTTSTRQNSCNSSLDPNYETLTINNKGYDSVDLDLQLAYSIVNKNKSKEKPSTEVTSQPSQPLNPTPVKDETPCSIEGEFYDAEQHTYSVVNKKKAKIEPPTEAMSLLQPTIPTPVRDETSKEDDFYDTDEHTYSVVNTKHKKKAQTEPMTEERAVTSVHYGSTRGIEG